MRMGPIPSRTVALLPLLAWLMAVSVRPTVAAPPWQKLAVFHKVDASPDKSYRVGDTAGPWLIMAYAFDAQDDSAEAMQEAESQAQELVLELRRKFRLKAYTHEMDFDFSGNVEGQGVDPHGDPKRMKYQRSGEFKQIAVMVGDFPSIDDPLADKTLRMLKYAQIDALAKRDVDEIRNRLAGFRAMQQYVLSSDNPKKQKGPLGRAFMVPNPLLPREYFVPKGPDKLVLEMNKGVEFSLLNCPGQYTVKVATFTGAVLVDQKKIKDAEQGKPVESRLAEAADRAHRLTMALRKQGVEAYEFHDRYSSLVTVGSFDNVGAPRQDGKIEMNPAVLKIIETYGAPKVGAGKPGVVQARTLDGIPLDTQPMLVETPHRLLSSEYEAPAALLGRR